MIIGKVQKYMEPKMKYEQNINTISPNSMKRKRVYGTGIFYNFWLSIIIDQITYYHSGVVFKIL